MFLRGLHLIDTYINFLRCLYIYYLQIETVDYIQVWLYSVFYIGTFAWLRMKKWVVSLKLNKMLLFLLYGKVGSLVPRPVATKYII